MNLILQVLMKFFGGASEGGVEAPDSNIDDIMILSFGPFDDIMVLDTMVAEVADDIMQISNDPDDIMILTRQ